MIVKSQQLEVARTTHTRAELREHLIELWATVFEKQLREEMQQRTEGEAPLSPSSARASQDGEPATLLGGHE